MAHAQKPDFVFRRNGQVHLNRRGRQFSRLLAAEVWASAVVMLDIPRSEVVWEYWLPTPFASSPFTSPPVRHRVPPGSERALLSMNWPRLMGDAFYFQVVPILFPAQTDGHMKYDIQNVTIHCRYFYFIRAARVCRVVADVGALGGKSGNV